MTKLSKQEMADYQSKFESFSSDEDRWKWIKDNQDLNITVYLDNDDTFATFEDDDDGSFLLQFDEFLGWSDGLFSLLTMCEIKHKSV